MRSLLALALLGLVAVPALAQDPNTTATFGEFGLDERFRPDPHEVALTAGGSTNLSLNEALETSGCGYGFVATAPAVQLHYTTSGNSPLYLYATSGDDTTILVNMPDGSWVCDDDSYGDLDPLLTIEGAPDGYYDIWVGTFSGTASATLYISEIDPVEEMEDVEEMDDPMGSGLVGAPDPNAAASYDDVTLAGGFPNDPYTVSLTAGGPLGVEVGVPECNLGSVAEAPGVKLHYAGGDGRDLYLYALSGGDTTILVSMPDGSWVCDDDSYGDLNPLLTIESAPDGRYDIWVGSFGDATSATLHISERLPSGGAGSGDEPDRSAAATYGEISLDAGFLPDPHTVSLTAGGALDVDVDTPGCDFGSVDEAPAYKLFYETSGDTPLYLYATSDEDTTILVNLPDGSWACNDDSYGGLNPLLLIPDAAAGRYDLWVGTFGGTAPATLHISERDPR